MRYAGEKIVLRDKQRTDVTNDYAWSTDEELCKLDAAKPTTLSFREATMLYEEELLYPPPRRQRFAIETMDGSHIGNCMLYDINTSRGKGELGIMIGDRRFWGKSYGTDAVNTLLKYVFTEMNLKMVYLHTLDWNVRAQKSFEKAGFVPKGKIRRNGHTFLAMEVRKDDWVSSNLSAEKEEARSESQGR